MLRPSEELSLIGDLITQVQKLGFAKDDPEYLINIFQIRSRYVRELIQLKTRTSGLSVREVVACDPFVPVITRTLGLSTEDLIAIATAPEVPRVYSDKEVSEMMDKIYLERNTLVAALANHYPAGTSHTAIEGWDPEWHHVVYIDLPTGQISYHFHDREAHLFAHLPPYEGTWDGHDKDTVHERLYALKDHHVHVNVEPQLQIEAVVCATSLRSLIGNNAGIPWKLPEDMKRFKAITTGYPILMGSKTALSIGKALPNRINLVLTHKETAPFPGQIRVGSMEEAIAIAKESKKGKLFVIGGAEVYKLAFPYLTGMHATWAHFTNTQVDAWAEDGGVFFPVEDWIKENVDVQILPQDVDTPSFVVDNGVHTVYEHVRFIRSRKSSWPSKK